MPLRRKNLPTGEQVTPTDVADAAMFGAIGDPVKLSADDLMELHELLGKPIKIGQRLLRLSSGNPEKNTAILHDSTTGKRVATTLTDLLNVWRRLGQDTAEAFPEGSVMSQMGERVTEAGSFTGPRGGIAPVRRKIPKTATR